MKLLNINIIFILLLCLFPDSSDAQITLYQEDFSSNDGKGQDGTTLDTTGVSNWSIDISNGSFGNSGDWFKVINGYFESEDTDASSASSVYWYSKSTYCSGLSNVTVSVDLGRNSSNSGSGVQAFYAIYATGSWGSWTSFGSKIGSGGTEVFETFSTASLSGDSIKIRIAHWGASATPSYRHDNVLITADDPCASETITQATNLTTPIVRTHSVELNWDRGDGGDVLVLAREGAAVSSNPTAGDTYTANSIFGSGSPVGDAFVVYKGTGTSVTITNLKKCTDYYFAVYEYNIVAGPFNCYKTPALTGSATTTSRIESYPYSQEFSAVSPCEFSSTDDTWDFAYAALAANYTSASHAGRLSSASSGNGKYIYIETEVEIGYTYELSFQIKRAVSLTINTNETADQTTLLSSSVIAGESSNVFILITTTFTPEYSGTMYWQILITTVFGDPVSLYVDDFGISSTLTSLPIELSSFTGKCTRSGLEVNWVSQSELNNHYFTLERANSDLNFEEITQVLGAGNSSNEITYRYIDPSPSFGINYYRLRQTDFNGVFEIFPPISVVNSCNDERNSAFFTDNKLTLRFNDLLSDNVGLSLYDVQGKTIYLASNVEAFKASPGTYELPFHLSLATGVYFLVLNDFNFNETYILKVHKP